MPQVEKIFKVLSKITRSHLNFRAGSTFPVPVCAEFIEKYAMQFKKVLNRYLQSFKTKVYQKIKKVKYKMSIAFEKIWKKINSYRPCRLKVLNNNSPNPYFIILIFSAKLLSFKFTTGESFIRFF